MSKVEVTMPKMGESITEGTVIVWHKQVGDVVELDEPLLEIGTDKVDTEVPSPSAGVVVQILVPAGETVEVGTVIAVIDPDPKSGTPGDGAPSRAKADPPAAAPAAPAAAGSAVEAPARASASAPAGGDRVEVVMPKMGESIMEGTIIAWHKQPGDVVELDEPLLEIGTDKVDTEVPSPSAGTLVEILYEAGATVEVGTTIAVLTTAIGAAVPVAAAPAPAARQEAAPPVAPAARREAAPPVAAAPVPSATGDGGPVVRKGSDGAFYSPLVRSIAEKEGVSAFELSAIQGSGTGGRVTKTDLLRYLERRAAAIAGSSGQAPAPASAPKPAREAPVATSADGRTQIIEMDRMRQIISEHMVRSKATSAHVTSFAEIDVTNLVRLREARKDDFQRREGVKLTYTPFFVFAAVEALKDHPLLNASVEGTKILVKRDFHVGIAVAIGSDKLMVPVIKYAGQKNVAGLAHAANDLAARARSKGLVPDDLAGGTFTVTNVGSLGSIMGTPIINQPQVAILATGAIKKRPMVIEDPVHGDLIGIRHMMYASLSYDHRIIDGAMAASYLQRYIQVLESFGPDYEL